MTTSELWEVCQSYCYWVVGMSEKIKILKDNPALSVPLREILQNAKIWRDSSCLYFRFSSINDEDFFLQQLWELPQILILCKLPLSLKIESDARGNLDIPQFILESEALKQHRIEFRLNNMVHPSISSITDNFSTDLLIPNSYSDREKVLWLMSSPTPATIVWEKGKIAQTPFLANPAYGELTSRPFTDWTGDEDNAKRWVSGELDRTLNFLDKDKQLSEYSWKVYMFGQGDTLFRWHGNIQRISIDGKLARITQVKKVENLTGMAV
ncbi:MAG: hypothetical protein AAGA60_31785 [Cyanobacteria bacterium P01_E01_bin.42]